MDLIAEKLCKSFQGKVILRNVSFQVPKGGILCMMGPSGCGKTTLLRMLMGLERPDSGTLRVKPASCAAVFQEDRLCLGLSVLENLRLTRPETDATFWKRHLQALDVAECMGQRVTELSGGMKRRVVLARCMANSAPLLLLDEPFQGLDEENRKRALQYIEQERQGRTLVLVTHDSRDAQGLHAEMMRLPLETG
ncbi:MAG: ATP-binding cassette domain-containing protein [Eubacteriales bacterium]|jgi:NitT/TauT family transport system ATP-binding protein